MSETQKSMTELQYSVLIVFFFLSSHLPHSERTFLFYIFAKITRSFGVSVVSEICQTVLTPSVAENTPESTQSRHSYFCICICKTLTDHSFRLFILNYVHL